MGKIGEHIKQAGYNEDTLDFLIEKNIESMDWIMTITFYYALHHVQVSLERDFGLNPSKHWDRKNHNNSRNHLVMDKFPDLWDLYYALFNESHKARYTTQGVYRDCTTYNQQEHNIEEAKKEFPLLII